MVPLVATLVVAALSAAATRNLWAAGTITFSFSAAALIILAFSGGPTGLLAAGSVSAALSLISLALAVRAGVFRRDLGTELKLWRTLARPFALLFILVELLWDHRFALVLIGVVAAIFIVSDLVRIFSRLHSDRLYKKEERKKFSSMTAFLVSVFVIFLLFPAPVSYLSLAFLTVGDLYGKLIGLRFGRIRLVERRTLEGSLGFAAGALTAGTILYLLLPYPVLYLVVGAPSAAAIEMFSKDVDDNLTVGLLSAVILSVLKLFFRI